MIPGIDVGWAWTDDAGAIPPAVVDDFRHRRRGYIGGVARLLIGALLLQSALSCGHPTAPCVPSHDTAYFHGDTLYFQLGQRCPK